MEIVLTAYFNSFEDPQRKIKWSACSFAKIAALYNSCKRLNLNLKIFYDNKNDHLVSNYRTKKIRFIRYQPVDDLLNARWQCFYDFLCNHQFTKVLCLDSTDTEIFKNPFPLIDNNVIINSENTKIGLSPYIEKFYKRAYGQILYPERKLLNCGILGAEYDTMIELLEKYMAELEFAKKKDCVDMAIWNTILYKYDYPIITGWPVHTRYTRHEGSESEAYIRHK